VTLLAAGPESWPPACLTLAKPGAAAVTRPMRVEVGTDLMAKARNRWPVERSVEGEPSLPLFERGPLAAAREYFSRYFDQALVEVEGSPVRYYMTVSTFFPVMGFFAIRVADHIEIIDFLQDDNYWDSLGDDPDD
jgi:hypothetical protein